MIVAIHQPNFFPWLGFFRKIAKADVFVFLDAVEFPQTSRGNWINRSRLVVNGRPIWITCPISKTSKRTLVKNAKIAENQNWKDKIRYTLMYHYGKHQYSEQLMPVILELLEQPENNLANFNIQCIKTLAKWMTIPTRFVRQSELQTKKIFELQGSYRLAAICKELKADIYLAGDGSQGYENEHAYRQMGIDIQYSRFNQLPYTQKGVNTFIQGLSILDALFNVGERTSRLLEFNNEKFKKTK